jgi:hypothetical protein
MTYTYTRRDYTPDEEDLIRCLTNPNGRGNAAYEPDRMPPQDRLIEAEITMGKTTGVACEFRWASGRKDVWCVIDLPKECVAAKVARERRRYIKELKERNHGSRH